jgi:hypothetical protein
MLMFGLSNGDVVDGDVVDGDVFAVSLGIRLWL